MTAPLLALVEDDDGLRQVLAMALTQEGYRTLLLAQGAGAYEAIRLAQPDLVLLNLWLEERETGWAVLEQLRADPATRHIPVILCSADAPALAARAERVQELGVLILAKPFDLDALWTLVRQVLGQRPPTPPD